MVCVYSKEFSPEKEKYERPARKATSVLVIEFSPDGSIEPDKEKITKTLAFSRSLLRKVVWGVKELKLVLGLWNWFLLLSKPAMSVCQKCFELSSSQKDAVWSTPAAYYELKLLIAFCPLIHAHFGRIDAEDMLCSNESTVGGATLYTKYLDLQLAKTNLVGNYHKTLQGNL